MRETFLNWQVQSQPGVQETLLSSRSNPDVADSANESTSSGAKLDFGADFEVHFKVFLNHNRVIILPDRIKVKTLS